MQIDLAALGLKQSDIEDKVVDALVEQLLSEYSCDDDGHSVYTGKSQFAKSIDAKFKAKYDEALSRIMSANFEPVISARVEEFVFQQTNQYGETTGKSLTITEYFNARINDFLLAGVDSDGRARTEVSDYNRNGWRQHSTRLAYHMDRKLAEWLNEVLRQIMSDSVGTIARTLNETVRNQINLVAEKLKIEIKTK